ncbi:MAG: hypothetical protein A3G83_08140 [Betaproteobacteria bacterium RIFCSPLOWO2_12_FULL_68_20]|nr:MAG: hypothetical protein A3G83_08140 [Betaproteobacteria bacterium RIFCSPLOWO2_12_FULL_68_20]
MRSAPTVASSAAPAPIASGATSEACTVKFAAADPIHTPGHKRGPRSANAASAIPAGGHTALAKPGGTARTSDAFAAAK